jgi:hypothetical protein
MAAIYSNGGNRWNILGFNFTKRDALSSVYKISMIVPCTNPKKHHLSSVSYSIFKMANSCDQALVLYIYYKMELHIVNFSLILKWNVDRLKELSVSCAIFQIGHVAVHLL